YSITGANTLTLDNTGSTSLIAVQNGTHSITAPITIAGASLVVSVSNNGILSLGSTANSGVSIADDNGAESLTLTGDGSGQLILSGSNTYGGGTTVSA